jgi:DNA-nicking Smr family endonuclease
MSNNNATKKKGAFALLVIDLTSPTSSNGSCDAPFARGDPSSLESESSSSFRSSRLTGVGRDYNSNFSAPATGQPLQPYTTLGGPINLALQLNSRKRTTPGIHLSPPSSVAASARPQSDTATAAGSRKRQRTEATPSLQHGLNYETRLPQVILHGQNDVIDLCDDDDDDSGCVKDGHTPILFAVGTNLQPPAKANRPSLLANLRKSFNQKRSFTRNDIQSRHKRQKTQAENSSSNNANGLPAEFIGRRRSPLSSSMGTLGATNKKRSRESEEQNNIQTIYKDARRPVELLTQQLRDVSTELQFCGYKVNSEEWRDATQRKKMLTEQLAHAQRNARDSVYSLMNDNPHKQEAAYNNNIDDNTQQQQQQPVDPEGYPIVDLHGLHVREALQLFDEQVKPVLSTLQTMTLITGWGKHSRDGKSVLQEQVKKHIRSCQNMKFEPVANNRGRLRVKWVENLSGCYVRQIKSAQH